MIAYICFTISYSLNIILLSYDGTYMVWPN